MNESKNTKKALHASLVSLFLCIVMLIGTTFAWFTDSASTGINKIQAGNLDVKLNYWNETSSSWVDAKDVSLFKSELWEPGYMEVQGLQVKNAGNLALKWKAAINSTGKLSELADVIDVYVKAGADYKYKKPGTRDEVTSSWKNVGTLRDFVNGIETTTYGSLEAGKTADLGLALVMSTEAGNKYQGMDLGGDITVTILATQDTYERDSFDDQYDAETSLDFVPVADVKTLKEAINTGKPVSLTKDIMPSAALDITNAVINGNGNQLSGGQLGSNARIVNLTTNKGGAASLTLNGVKMVGETNQYNSKGISAYDAESINLDITNSSIEAKAYAIRIGTGVKNGATLNVKDSELIGWAGLDANSKVDATFKNTTFKGSNGNLSGKSNSYNLVTLQAGSQNSTLSFENCTFDLTKSGQADYYFFGASLSNGNITIKCKNCTFIYDGQVISNDNVPKYTYRMSEDGNTLTIQ